MTYKRTYRLPGALALLLARVLLVALVPDIASQAQQPALQITVPATGTIVSPGQTLSVTVTSPAGLAFSQVVVIGEVPIGMSTIATSVPAQFSVNIPSQIACGPHMLTAEGTTTTGQNAESASIMIDVERSDFPAGLSASISGLTFESQGEQSSLRMLATFLDSSTLVSSTLDVTESTLVSYASSNAAVATINTSGTVTATGTGNAMITLTYTQGGQNIKISVPVTVVYPMVTASPTSLTFPGQAVGSTSATQQVTMTNVSNGVMSVLNVGVAGDFSETDNCITSSPLAAGGGCTVNVTFSPTATGSRTGKANIASSANIVPISIPLTGTGTATPPTPTITTLNPTSGAIGTSVTITGTNFGATQGTGSVNFNGTAATPTSWSATSIIAPVPSGATTGNVLVTVGGVVSNGVNFTVQGTTNGIALVQFEGSDAGTTTSYSLPFDSNNAAGNWIAVCIRAGQSGQSFTVTDSRGNTYHNAVQFNDTLDTPNGNTIAIFYTENIAAGANTVTVSDTISGTLRFVILEYSGVATANSLDVVASAQGSGTSPNSGNATTTANGDLLLGAIATADPATFTAPSGFTIREFVPAEPGTKLVAEDKIQTAAGSAAATASLSASDPWGALLAAFKKAHP